MTQTWNPERYGRNARFVSDLGAPVLALLAPKAGEKVLDLGCGDGVLTAKIAAAGARVIGIDASAEQIVGAQRLGIDARVLDAHHLDYDAEFDAVFSNATLHWLSQSDRVLDGVWRALKPGGRFVAEMGGAGNVDAVVEAITTALRRRKLDAREFNPWYFPDVSEYRKRLETAGFRVLSIALIPRPTPIPGDVGEWLHTFAESFLVAVPANECPQLIEEIRTLLKPKLCAGDGPWTIDYVRLRFAAQKPESAAG